MTADAGLRFDMPVSFGPSPIPEKTLVADAGAAVLTFETTPTAAQALLPDGFVIAERPIVSVSYVYYRDVDYLGGRGYNEIVITVSARHRQGEEAIDAGYAAVLWVNQIGALIAGREYMGLPKLLGTIPDAATDGDTVRFTCLEYDALLMQGEARNLRPIPAERMEGLNARAGEVRTFGRKYIAAPGGRAHLDCPMLNVMRWSYKSAWTGTGSIRFFRPRRVDAPLSWQAMAVLSVLPQLGDVRAFYGKGEALIDRTATRCL